MSKKELERIRKEESFRKPDDLETEGDE